MILNFACVPQVDSQSQSEAWSQGWHIPHNVPSTPTRHHPIMTFFCPLKVAHSKPDKTHILTSPSHSFLSVSSSPLSYNTCLSLSFLCAHLFSQVDYVIFALVILKSCQTCSWPNPLNLKWDVKRCLFSLFTYYFQLLSSSVWYITDYQLIIRCIHDPSNHMNLTLCILKL